MDYQDQQVQLGIKVHKAPQVLWDLPETSDSRVMQEQLEPLERLETKGHQVFRDLPEH